jgi:hypothetical protein
MSISLEYPRATRPLPEELLPQLPGYKAKVAPRTCIQTLGDDCVFRQVKTMYGEGKSSA